MYKSNETSNLVNTPHDTEAEHDASIKATLQPTFMESTPQTPLDGITTASAAGQRGQPSVPASSMTERGASVVVTSCTGSLPSSRSCSVHYTTSTPPPLPPLLVSPAKREAKAGCHGGASLFRDWSMNATLLDEVLSTPFFHLLPTTTESTAGTATASAAAPDAALQSVALPTRDAPLPSILLIALSDIEMLQQSFCAHTLVNPVKDQLNEFKRLVASSMRSELTQGQEKLHNENLSAGLQPAATVAVEVRADHSAVSGECETAGSATMCNDNVAHESALIVSSLHAHDAAVRAALRSAHGFLYGSEVLPVGVPALHLQRARREWLTRYRVAHVQPHLQKAQRRRYEVWAQQHSQAEIFAEGGASGDAHWRGASVAQNGTTPVSMCAALQPPYWRNIFMEWPSLMHTTTRPATADMLPAEVGGRMDDRTSVAQPKRRPLLPGSAPLESPSHALSMAKKAAETVPYNAAWDVDLYDDLGLTVSADQFDIKIRQVMSRIAVEAMEFDELGPKLTTTEGCTSFPSSVALSAVRPLLRCGAHSQMQLTLPVFVYVVSRYLFVAHYAAYFPAGLFSRALIDPFYFPDAAQCTPEYALRAAPALQREARRVHANYAAQMADAHRCFPDRTLSTEVPLPPNDMFHLWELLCPPQSQDVAGRWNPIPWGHLTPEEEGALLEEEFRCATHAGQESTHQGVSRQQPLLSYPYARAARQTYRQRLQQLAQHPSLLAEVHRLLSQCEDIAMQFFTTVDIEQKGCITWESFTNALIEEADVQDHQRKVRERAVHLTRTSASVFDRYIVEPLPATLTLLGYTGNVLEVRHSSSLVMLEGASDYAVCDGTQLGSIHQRFLVRPIEVLCKELEEEPRDAFGRVIGGPRRNQGGDDAQLGKRRAQSATDTGGYDAALRQRPWRNNQRPLRVYIRYEDGRRLQELTALSVLQQLNSSQRKRPSTAASREGSDDREETFKSARAHQPAKLVSLEGVLAVENVSPCVPWPVFVARGNDMLLRLYGTSRAVQALPEAGVLHCAETVTSMEWAAGGRRERRSSLGSTTTTFNSAIFPSAGARGGGGAAKGDHTFSSTVAQPPQQRGSHDRIFVQREEYLLLGTRDGTILLVDLYALLNRVPRLAMPAGIHRVDTFDDVKGSAAGNGTGDVGGKDRRTRTLGAAPSAMQPISERIGSSVSAWSGYSDLAHRTYYADIGSFVVHTRQVHTPGTLVSSVIAAATNGLVVSSGLDGYVFTMRLVYPSPCITSAGTQRTPNGVAAGVGSATADTGRPLVCIEVLHRMRVCDTGVRYALPIPFLSMLAVQTATNKVYLYHTSVLPTGPALAGGGRSDAASAQAPSATLPTPRAVVEDADMATDSGVSPVPAASSATPPRLELYDAAAPHLGSIVSMILVNELDQLITVDSSGYVKVWSLRQAQPVTSFYALAPLNLPNSGSDAGRLAGWSSSQGSGAAHRGNGNISSTSSYDVSTDTSALLRMTKNSIEVAVESAEYRLQPCRSAAYNYAGRQLFVMGRNNAAHCFFVSGQSSSRAHTQPLRTLLVDTSTVFQAGTAHHRLISFSSADCRIWPLLTGAMELGIRANSSEYCRLFNNRLTGKSRGGASSMTRSVERQPLERKGDHGCRLNSARPRSNYRTRMYNAHNSVLQRETSSSTTTTDERRRLLPPSVDDVMRAVSARPWGSHGRLRRCCTKLRSGGAAVSPHKETTVAAETASFHLLTTPARPQGSAGASGTTGSATGQGTCTEDDTDGLVTNAVRDHNQLSSDIRCACLGPGGEWVGYALLHGDIRLHRSDSGRLLHTFITTPPSTEDLVEAAMQYQHLFTSATVACTVPPLHSAIIGNAAPATSQASPGISLSRGSGGGASASTSTALSLQSSAVRLTPILYAKAVALVLERLLTTTIGVNCSSVGAVPASAMPEDEDEGLGHNVHREPLYMLYLDATQELLVTYADGLLRSFTLLSHSNTATRVIVSRTLMNRALMLVRSVLASHIRHANLVHPSAARGASVPAGRLSSLEGSLSAAALKELSIPRPLSVVSLGEAEGTGGCHIVEGATGNSRPLSRATCSEGAGGVPIGQLNNVEAAQIMSAEASANIVRSMMASLSTRPVEPDVVLLATASSPLGLVCLVHASGLVTVLDVQSRSETDGAARMRMLSDAHDMKGGLGDGGAEQSLESGRCRAQAGVVVHSFMTTDEITAVMFLGAYPCLVLADRQHQLSFHLMKGSSLLALLGEFGEQLERDVMACAAGLSEHADTDGNSGAPDRSSLTALPSTNSHGAAPLPSLPHTGGVKRGAGRGLTPTTTSSTLVWTFSVTDTCASQRSLGQITALTFDPLYATVYVGTSQGYIVSYLVRRFLMAFQLTPVFLRGVDGVSVSTYAAELQRTLTKARPGASPCTNTNSNFLHNYLRVIFDAPAAVATQVTENHLRSLRKRHVNMSPNPSMATTKASQSPNVLSSLIDIYRCRGDLFHVSWRGVTGKRRGGGSNSRYVAAPSPAISISTSSDVLIAAAVLHDAVTCMMTVTSAHNTNTQACSSTTAKPDETQPWWCTPAGQRVREYVTRRCRGDTDWSDMSETTGTTNANPTNLGELELDAEGVQLLRAWVEAALSERRRYMPQHTSGAGSATEARQQQPQKCFSTTPDCADDQVSCTSSNETFSSGKFTAVPPMPTTANDHDISASCVSHVSAEQGVDAGVGGGATTARMPTTTAQELAEALTQEVQEELLLGKEAPSTVAVTHYGTVSPFELNTPAVTAPHPITDSWVECLFTRQAMSTTSRSPLCLLTPPAMLERARRERQDRRGRMTAIAAGAGNAVSSEPAVPEWNTYVEGALPDYLADVLSHPSQVLTEVERQALQQRSITVLQCRRNGYLCVGHADGGVTLWTPYACARLESLCPSTSLAATLDRLAVSVKSQFHCLHARIVLERQRLAFEGSLRSGRHTEEERITHMKSRIRAMLLEQHLAQLQLGRTAGKNRAEGNPQTLAGEDQDTEPPSTLATPATRTLNQYTWSASNARRHSGRAAAVKIKSSGTGSAPRQPFFCGPMEAELLLMRPLLCLLLGISSPAELLARQLSLEDLFFLPFRVRNIASLEAFDPHCYDVAVAVAMRRLRRDLIEEAEEHATEELDGAPQLLPDVLTTPVTQALPTISPAITSPAFPFSQNGNSGLLRCKRLENVYTYRLSSLARAWHNDAHRLQRRQPSEASGAAFFPGALRLLLHRAMERPPYLPNGAVATNPLRTVVPAAEPVSSGKTETVHSGSADAAGAPSLSPTPAGITECTVPIDGEYYEVCHALQVAEVQAESQWEVEELGRAWKQLHAFAAAPTASSSSASWNREHDGADVCGSPLAPLPFSSAAAVSTAVHRQVRRGLEARIVALSSRAVVAALLQNVRMCCRPSHTKQVIVPSHLHSGNGEPGTCAAWQPPSGRRGGGLAWVQSVLRQQAWQAFSEPLLTWLQLLPSPVSPAVTTTACGPVLLHGQKRSPATSTTARPALSDEEVLLPPSTNAPLQVLSDASSMPGGDGGDPQATFADSLKECSNAFLTELPRNETVADTAVGASSSPPEPTRLVTSGHTAAMRGAVGEAGQCPLSSQIPSAAEQMLLHDVRTTLSSRQTFSSSPSPLPQLKCMHASTSSGHRLSSLGVHDARALKTDRGTPAASPTSDTISLLSCSISSTSSLSMTGASPNATLSGPAVHPTLQERTHRLAPPALHRVKLESTGSCRGAPHQQRVASRGMTCTKGVAGDRTVVEDALRAAASMTTAPPIRVTGYGSGRKSAGGGARSNRVAAVQSFTYYSLLGQAGTTK